jgi:NAD(P)-dependent dehydrogenase (short-subunit alcohol dehydrogenase family)
VNRGRRRCKSLDGGEQGEPAAAAGGTAAAATYWAGSERGRRWVEIGRLEGKVAVITGAASGIGRESARRFAAEGARVCVVDLSDEAGEEVAAEVDGLYLHADVTDEDEVAAMYARAAQRWGGIDVLFNNAGIAPPDDVSVLDTSLEAWRRVQEVNLTAVFLCCKHGIPHLLARGGGRWSTPPRSWP